MLPDLDGDTEQHSASHSRVPTAAAAPAAASQSVSPGSAPLPSLAAAGRSLRRGIGSTASIEEDVFSSVGGLELGQEHMDPADQQLQGLSTGTCSSAGGAGGLALPSVASLADLAPVETPSRTLFVQNVAPDVPDEDIRRLFAAHGDMRIMYTACKQRGFVIVGYFDLRSALSAAQSLQGVVLCGRHLEVGYSAPRKGETNQVNQVSCKPVCVWEVCNMTLMLRWFLRQCLVLEPRSGGRIRTYFLVLQGVVVVYNLDPDTTNEQLVWIFSRFGDVKDIQQAPQRSNQKFIEFYDVRHAAAALKAMNKAELSRLPGQAHDAAAGARQSRVLSGDDGTPQQLADSNTQATNTAVAALQQLEWEQQQQQQLPSQSATQGQPVPRPPSFDLNMALAMQQADAMQQVANRGMVRPVSGMLDRMHTGVSPPLNLGPLSQSWDTSGQPGGLLSMLNRQQQQPHAQQQQQPPSAQLLQQQQQQLLLQQALASGYLRGSRTDLSGLVSVLLLGTCT